jgi:hypothetical protein
MYYFLGLSRVALLGRDAGLPERPPGLALALAFALALGSSLVGKSLDNAVVSGVLGEVGEPEEGSTLAGEDVGHPAEGVVKVPGGDTDAALDLDAGADDLFC